MKVLTIAEEKRILESLQAASFIDNGASRLVFECTDIAAEIINVDAEDYVIKLAIGLAGINQNTAEIQFAINRAYAPVAEIAAYGRFVEVMERVEIEHCYRDFAEEMVWEGNEDEAISCAEDYDLDPDEAEEAFDVILILRDYFGHTSDNGQLGRNRRGELVAYDYGFFSHSDSRQMADIDNMLECSQQLRISYVCGLIGLLEKDEDALDRYEKLFYERVDNDVDPNKGDYRFMKYQIYGFDDNGRFFQDDTSNYDMVEYTTDQLKEYIVLAREYYTSGLESEAELISEVEVESDISDESRAKIKILLNEEK